MSDNDTLECENIKLRVVSMGKDIEHLRDVMKLTFVAGDRERLLALSEVNRRLDLLNGEAGRLVKMQDTYVPRETYDTRNNNFEKDLRELRDFKNNSQGRQTILSVVVSAAISLAFVFLSWMLKTK